MATILHLQNALLGCDKLARGRYIEKLWEVNCLSIGVELARLNLAKAESRRDFLAAKADAIAECIAVASVPSVAPTREKLEGQARFIELQQLAWATNSQQLQAAELHYRAAYLDFQIAIGVTDSVDEAVDVVVTDDRSHVDTGERMEVANG